MSSTMALPITSEEINHNPSSTKKETMEQNHQAGIHLLIDIVKYSKLNKLSRVTAYVLRFITLLRRKERTMAAHHLTSKELMKAEKIWIRCCQNTSFHKQIANLSSKTPRRLPLVRQLRLFLDPENLLRCGGRIHNAPLNTSAKFPYLLPKNHRLQILSCTTLMKTYSTVG